MILGRPTGGSGRAFKAHPACYLGPWPLAAREGTSNGTPASGQADWFGYHGDPGVRLSVIDLQFTPSMVLLGSPTDILAAFFAAGRDALAEVVSD